MSLPQEEIDKLKANISVFDREKAIIYFKEYEYQDPTTVKVSFDEINRLSTEFDTFYLLIDLSDAGRPSPLAKRELNKRFRALKDRLLHISYVTGKNFLINAAIRFVMYKMNLNSYSIHSTQEKAVEGLNERINKS